MKLSLCAIVYNEEQFLGGMLQSVEGLVDEAVIAIDGRTIDHTLEVAAAVGSYPTTILPFDWCDDFSYARNLTLAAAHGDWILVLDADERLTPAGAAAIRQIIETASPEPTDASVTGIAFMLMNYDLDGSLRSAYPTSKRLFRNRPEIRYMRRVHEEPIWLPDPERTELMLIGGEAAIIHFGYSPEVYDGRGKSERNLRLLKMQLAEHPEDEYARSKLRQLEQVQEMSLGR